jgi:hypothetical protein
MTISTFLMNVNQLWQESAVESKCEAVKGKVRSSNALRVAGENWEDV